MKTYKSRKILNYLIILIIVLSSGIKMVKGQCTANYSYSGTTDTLTFTNLSSVSNAHFYWNFGDGSGSNDFSPVHVFPDDGKYLVTLYGVDTVSNCVDVKENWINVIKPDTLACNVFFTDTIVGNSPQTTNLSTNCSGLHLGCHVFANAQNICNGFSLGNWGSSLFLHGMQAASSDSIYGYRIFNAYYETLPYDYFSSNNYQNCSANFEFVIDYQPNQAVVTFNAMNKNATSYTFSISGFGNPIPLNGPSASFNFNYISYRRVSPTLVTLRTHDSVNNCSDTITQTILIKNPNYVFPPNCAIFAPIQSETAVVGTNVQFYISASSNANFQWQQDAGLGYVNLTNAGPYSGVTTNTLTIANVQLTMNNFQYRCIVYDSLGACHNTSSPASLSFPAGIQDIEFLNFKIFPNPASSYLTVDLPTNIHDATVNIYNMLGQQQIRATTSKQQTNIDLAALTNGVYVVEVSSRNKIGRQRFVKQ
ncbi:MAG: T9SS type A sorting domain-containing protein [Bacteroidia bacterium]|nr:T9SS type A sorting domain-containing protein [Bacteroidota bacterium]MBP6720863.1 T9SS type A sorting domain-containing protein [Bacteroidia bacterium]MBP8073236.1 T9SS type A sorting domain-containing protein [Bacteroidia bacterium]